MKEEMLEQLFDHIKKMRSSLSAINIANLNFDNPPKANIKKTSRTWVLFYDECKDFVMQFENEFDMSTVQQALEVKGDCIYEGTLTTIERELRKIERQIKLQNSDNVKQINISKPRKVFISHSAEDKEYAQALVELLEDIGVQENQIFCSSLREYGVKIGEDIYERLKSEFRSYDLWVFFMLSNNYYNSAASLNEMGAAWILQKDYLSILLPDFSFSEIKGAINPNRIGIQLNSSEIESMLNDLKDNLCEKFDCTISQNRWERVRKEFINKIHTLR